MTREELIELVKEIMTAEGTEEEISQKLALFKKNVPHPRAADFIYHDDLSAEEVVDKSLAYKPIQL
jgi:hypothetical protein